MLVSQGLDHKDEKVSSVISPTGLFTNLLQINDNDDDDDCVV